MKRGILTLALGAALLTGCTAAPEATPTPEPTTEAPAPSAGAGCPDITAGDFAINIPSTPADPIELADTVGLADVLEGTCAYGFESDQVSGVAFFVVGASSADAGTFFAGALKTAIDAGFQPGDSVNPSDDLIILPAQRSDGAAFLVGHNSDVQPNDTDYTPERMAAIGLQPGDSLLFGSIQLP